MATVLLIPTHGISSTAGASDASASASFPAFEPDFSTLPIDVDSLTGSVLSTRHHPMASQ